MSLFSADIRKEYERGRLLESDAPADPYQLFDEWLREAVRAGIREPNAMTLATATERGRPSARVVLLKGFDKRGFSFFTNYDSRKGEELAGNPWSALCFWWGPLERQIRIEGSTERLDAQESDAYYATRPRGSRLSAWASQQSQVIAGRQALEERLSSFEAQYAHSDPPRPPHWGGYLVVPNMIEFWQGGPNRLHDRLRYTHQSVAEGSEPPWQIERLSP